MHDYAVSLGLPEIKEDISSISTDAICCRIRKSDRLECESCPRSLGWWG